MIRRLRRRGALALVVAGALAPPLVRAQQPAKLPVIGFLHPGIRGRGSATIEALYRDMGTAGLVDGRTVRVEERWGGGDTAQLTAAARELLALDPAVIIAVARPAVEAVRALTTTVPIVASDLENDPLAAGWVASLSRPGGNVTGQFLDAPAICGKWLQQISELVPNLRKLAVLWDSGTGPYQRDAFLAAAKAASVEATLIEFKGGAPVEAVVEAGLTPDIQALVQLGSPIVNQSGPNIAAVLARHRLPGISPFRTFSEGGGLISYGVDLQDMYRRLVPFLVKVLRGTKPGDIPIEQPVKFEMVVNLKTAKAFGLTLPPKFLLSADEVIE